jgi:hypothetical protein
VLIRADLLLFDRLVRDAMMPGMQWPEASARPGEAGGDVDL